MIGLRSSRVNPQPPLFHTEPAGRRFLFRRHYSPEWVEHYRAACFVDVDPAIQVGLRRMLPIDWSEFDREVEEVRRLFGEAFKFGLGRGISLASTAAMETVRCCLSPAMPGDRDWKRLRPQYMRDFQVLALHMHQAVLRLAGGPQIAQASLSPRAQVPVVNRRGQDLLGDRGDPGPVGAHGSLLP